MQRLILASSSERRRLLLSQIGYIPDIIISPDIDESILKKEKPKEYSIRIAKEKAIKVSKEYKDDLVLSADTVVSVGRRILDKPLTEQDAYSHLKILSGRRHRVYTSVAINFKEDLHIKTGLSIVKFKRLSEQEIKLMVEAKEWEGKCGGYALQGIANAFISWIRGTDSNIIGLPLHITYKLLNSLGCYPKKDKI